MNKRKNAFARQTRLDRGTAGIGNYYSQYSNVEHSLQMTVSKLTRKINILFSCVLTSSKKTFSTNQKNIKSQRRKGDGETNSIRL